MVIRTTKIIKTVSRIPKKAPRHYPLLGNIFRGAHFYGRISPVILITFTVFLGTFPEKDLKNKTNHHV